MDDHASEEYGVKPWERAVESGNQAPGDGKEEITGIMNLASISVPPVSEDGVSRLGLDGAGVLDRSPGKLGERLAVKKLSAFLVAETILLRVGGVPDPIHEQIRGEEPCQEIRVPLVGGGVVVRKIEGAVAVAERNTSQVPENQHETPLFVVHIPRSECQRKCGAQRG